MKELQQKVLDLEKHYLVSLSGGEVSFNCDLTLFQKFVEKSSAIPPSGKAGKHKFEQLQEDLMALRIREANALAEVKEVKQQVMELQTDVS